MTFDNREFVKLAIAGAVAAFCLSWVFAAVAGPGDPVDLSGASAKLDAAATVGDIAVVVDKAKQAVTLQTVEVAEQTYTRGEIEGEMARVQAQIDELTKRLTELAQLATIYDTTPAK